MRNGYLATSLSVAALMGAIATPAVMAQENQVMEEVITTGTRLPGRSATDSPVPVDVLSAEEFANQGDTDLSNLLRNVVPSYNVNTQPISDAASIVRPANLRGLAPDHTLVLVNGKRRHRAAVIYWLGNGVADGAQGPDISAIPSIALRQVEVLRDGAAAQYGSDAIAGVMNFKLKDDAEGGSVEVRYGEFFEGDGTQTTISANIGLPFTANGFANLSAEFGNTDPTDRSIQRQDANDLISNGNTEVGNPAQIWGQPDVDGEVKLWANIGLDLDSSKQFYAFGNYVEKTVEGGFYFRNPNTRGGVFSPDSGATLLVGDVLQAESGGNANCPIVPITNHVPDAAPFQQVLNDPNCFVFNEMFPGGFTPRFGGDLTDLAGVIGVRGETEGGLLWDVSGAVGYNDVDFFIRNTVNASLGPQTPTEFNPGAYTQLDKNFNIDLSYPLNPSWNLAGGFEYREEQFEITVGDEASFKIGPYAEQGFSAASNGFPGFSNLAGGEWDRANFALYVDLEGEVMDNWTLGFAGRWEDFDDFGSTTNFKLASNFRVSDAVALRAAYSTGFRAPTPGQSNAFNVSTEFSSVTNDLVNKGTIPSINPVAVLKGGQALDPEESVNWSIGAIFEFGDLALTVDYFNIKLEDRITVSQDFELDPAERAALLASGVTSAGNIDDFRFFTNDFDTTTKGFDIVATYAVEWSDSSTDFSLAYNQTETEVDKFSPEKLDLNRIRELQEGLPETRWNLSATHAVGDWRMLARVSFYDGWYDSEDDRSYGEETLLDLEAAYTINQQYTITLGAQNVLDEYPDENPNGPSDSGRRYSQFSPSGFGGGYWYMRLRYDF